MRDALSRIQPQFSFSLRTIQTTGDRRGEWNVFDRVGVFVRELEEALLGGKIQMAVHSLKDLPTTLPQGLYVPCVPVRANPFDALVTRDGRKLDELPEGARIGTSSLRRRAQLLRYRPDLRVLELRGNLDTRLRKLREGQYDAIVIAVSGMERLGRKSEITETLPEEVVMPPAGQGALGIELHKEDELSASIVAPLNDQASFECVSAERMVMRELGAGCRVPVAVLCTREERLKIRVRVCDTDGRRCVEAQGEGETPEQTVGSLLSRLDRDTVRSILMEIRGK